MDIKKEKKEYLDQLVDELLCDETWDLPQKDRNCLKADLEWNLCFL